MKKEEKKVVFGLLGKSKFIMRYLNGLEQLYKLSMGFLKEIMEMCGNPPQIFLHACGLVTLFQMYRCQWDKTSAFSGVFYWPVTYLQMCEGCMCSQMSTSSRISNRLFLTDQMEKPVQSGHPLGIAWIRVVRGTSFCVLVFTDNNSWLQKWALKEYFFVRSSVILRFISGIGTTAVLFPRMDVFPVMSINTGSVLYLAPKGFLFD